MPGVPSPAPTPADEGIFKSGRTIYTAGYTLTLDNVNTRIGTNAEQTTYRPFISGGTYKNQGTIGQKSIVNIKNVNDETRFRTIYAGDYWLERNHAFELNLDSTIHSRLILDQTIHTGGIILPYKGDVTINVAGDTTYLTLDHTKHLGNVDVNASGKALLSEMKYNQVRNLTLSDDAYIEMKSGMTFEVENLSIKDDALLDFRKMETNPKVRGSFTGSTASTADTTKTAGAIALNQNQTLEIQGEASGVTRLNNHERIPGQLVKLAHPYITAAKDSTAEFLIEAVENDPERKVVQSINDQNRAAWVVTNNISQNFKTFQWNGGDEQLVDPEGYDEFVYPIQYINDQGQAYLPEDSSDFTLTLIKDGKVVTKEDVDEFIELDFDFYIDLDGAAVLTFQEDNKYKGDIELQLTHTSGQIIKKNITILRNASALTGDVAIEGTPKVGQTLSAKTNLSNDAENLKYKWLANGKEILGESQSKLVLKDEYIGKEIQVEVRTSNYTGTLSSSKVTVLTNKLTGKVALSGTPKVGQRLTVETADLSTDETTLTYKWFVDGQEIPNETQSTLMLKEEHIGKAIKAEVYADNYEGILSSSEITVLMNELTGNVMLTGTPKVAQTLTATTTNLPTDAKKLTYQWFVDDAVIVDATQSTFAPQSEHIGKVIKVVVRSNNYTGALISSGVTVVTNQLSGTVTLTGTPQVGQTLTATTDKLPSDATELTYKWFANGKEILGETKSTFELQKQHAGQKIKVQISASNYVGTLSSTEVTVPELNHQRPTLQGLSEVIIRQGKTFDLTSGVSATDEDGQDITAQIQFPTVDFAQLPVGRHELEYSVTDKNGLTSSIKRILIVESNQAPVIQGLAPVTLKMNEVDQFKKLDKVLVTDDHDQNLIPTVTGTIVAPQPGQVLTSKLIYTVKDNDGNITTSERLITVTNHLPKVQANSIMIKAGEAIDLLKDTRINLLATDIEDGNLLDRIQVTNESGLNTSNPVEGKYPVTYTVTDVDGNTVYATIMINVQSNQSPILHGVTAITLKLGEVNQFNPLDGVTVEDDHNQNLNPTVTGIIDKPKAGQSLTSTLTYTVIDNEGNQTTLDRLITVTNYLPVLQVTPITIKANQAIDLLKDSRLNLLATDIEDGDLTEQITVKNSGGLDVNKPVEGEYVVTYTVTDSDGNTTEQTVNIKVQSNHAPTISGANDQRIISGEEFDLLAGVEAFDVEDGKLSNIQVTGTINPHQIGEQSISYQVTDKDGNVTTVNRFITVIYQTETPSDSTISETLIPHTQTQLNQLIEDIKAYDNQATVVEVKEDLNYYRYKIKLSLNLTTYSISTTNLSEYVIEIKVAKSIQHEVGLPALKPEENNNSEIKPEEKPEDNNNSEIKPEEKPEDNNNSETKPEEKPEDNNNSETKPEEKPEDNNNSETKPEEKPVTGYSNLMGYLGGGMIALGGIVSFKKKKK